MKSKHRPFALFAMFLSIAGASATDAAAAQAPELFVDKAPEAGLDFVHFNGMSGELYFNEVVGSGAAAFDYDNDGDLDLYLVQGNMLGEKSIDEATFKPASLPLKDRLYRNDTKDGKVRFTDVTGISKIESAGYGMGVAAGDMDNDGWIDLYITNFGPNEMFRNNGDGTFSEVTKAAGVGEERWSVSAAFLDFDRDGWLDLYVGNYVDYTLANDKPCRTTSGRREYCGPSSYVPETDTLFRNKGNGRFENVSVDSGITKASGGALGVVAADFNGDAWIDIYVANDGVPNQLWINQKDGTFIDDALLAGVAVNDDGMPEASMGVDAADFDGDGDEDLFMTHLTRETNTLYVNDGTGWFEDQTVEMGLAHPSYEYTGFGTAWFDYDNDGWLDILSVNGAVLRIEEQLKANDLHPLKQLNQLFRNVGKGKYKEVTGQAGAVFELSEVSRGAAFGDLDNDGDTDVLITNNGGPARLLINQTGNRNHWLGIRIVDERLKRDALGARAVVDPDGDTPPLWRRIRTDGCYASSNDPRILFGLAGIAEPQDVTVIWPDGERERWEKLPADNYHTLKRGSGSSVKP